MPVELFHSWLLVFASHRIAQLWIFCAPHIDWLVGNRFHSR